MANELEPIKMNELPILNNVEEATFVGYVNGKSGRISFEGMKPLFGLTSELGQSNLLVVHQKALTEYLKNKADEANKQGTVVRTETGELPITEMITDKKDSAPSNYAVKGLQDRLYGSAETSLIIPTSQTTTFTDFTSASSYYYSNIDVLKGLYIAKINLKVAKAGTLSIIAGKNVNKANYTYRIIKKITITSVGVQDIDINHQLESDEVIGFGLVGDTINIGISDKSTNTIGGSLLYMLNGSWSTLKYNLCIAIYGSKGGVLSGGDINKLSTRIEEVASEIKTSLPDSHINIYESDFSNLSDFSTVGTWNQGTPTTNKAYIGLKSIYNVDNRIMRLTLTMQSDTILKIPCAYGGINDGHGASCFGVDFQTKRLIIYAAGNGSNDQDYTTGYTDNTLKSSTIPTNLIGNREYVIEVSRLINTHTLKLYDKLTGGEISVTYDGWGAGLQNEQYIIQHIEGGLFSLKHITISTLNEPDIVIVGDSISEGAFVIPHNERFSDLLRRSYSDKAIVLSARSGATIDDVLAKFESEYNKYLPKNMIVTIGTNGGNTVDKLTLLKQKCQLIGCHLYVNHITCNTHTGALSNASVNTVIESLNFKGCRFDIATALNNNPLDGINTVLFAADKGHPNKDGNIKMYQRFAIDIPELFYRMPEQQDNYTDSSSDFTELNTEIWDGSNKVLDLNSLNTIYLGTDKPTGSLMVKKGYFDKTSLTINNMNFPLKGNTLINFIKNGSTLYFFESRQKVSTLIADTSGVNNGSKIFTGDSTEVISSSKNELLTTGAFSLGVRTKISPDGFIAIGRGTTSIRYWDFIFTNYQTNGKKEASITVDGTTQAIASSLNTERWYKFIVTYNGTNSISIYVDGILKQTISTTAIKAGGEFHIGSVLNLLSKGSFVSNVFMVNKELNQSEITQMQSVTSPYDTAFSKNVVEYWDFSYSESIIVSNPKLLFSEKIEPVLKRGANSWDKGDIANPDVNEDTIGKSGYKYIMNYSGYGTITSDSNPKWRMCLAYSNDLENWVQDVNNPIFSPNENEGYISCNGSIVCFNGLYYHYYQRGNSGDLKSSQICLATSPDLKTWTRQNNGNPIIRPTDGSYDSLSCYDPCVKVYDNIFYMVYTAYSDKSSIGFATSLDGIVWEKKRAIITQSGNVSEPSIVKIGNAWYIAHDVYTSGNSRELYGGWWDGKSHIVTEKILSRGGASWKSASVFDSTLVYSDGLLYMFYAGGNIATPNEGLNANIGTSVAQI